MQTIVTAIFDEYNKAKSYKDALGEKGLSQQSKINERFYSGNQWYGVTGGNDRPLVRHNIIKRIGDFKISQTLSNQYVVGFFAEGEDIEKDDISSYKELKNKAKKKDFVFKGKVSESEISAVCRALSGHFKHTAERIDIKSLSTRVLKEAYLRGAGVLYTFFDSANSFGTDFEGERVSGDIKCEVLNINDVYFADGTLTCLQEQPYIILASMKRKDEILELAREYGTIGMIERTEPDENGKILVLTKLYKERTENGESVKCIMVTEKGVLRPAFDTRLHLYPLSVFCFGDAENTAYGESEVTYLIPNQIAINRMITASVWSNIAAGMPMMLVNGDTVSGDISNDPGQIIKIYGTNEDVSSAVKFVSPPDYSSGLNEAVNNLIYNTLTQSGASPTILGDEQAQNASAIEMLQNAALIPLDILKSRYRSFLRETALIWLDFWLNLYLKRKLKIEDEDGIWYFPFDAARYSGLRISVSMHEFEEHKFTIKEKIAILGELFERGVITAKEYIARLPESIIDSRANLAENIKEKNNATE